jgi:two-component system, chemotaxis family, sensor kinase CheA
LSELEDQVEEIFATVEELREVAGDGPATRKLLDSLFRAVHSLKANASASGLSRLGLVAHEFENLLYSLRTGKTSLDNDTWQILTESSDALFNSLTLGEPPSGVLATNAVPSEIWNSLKEEEKHSLKQSVDEGASLFLVQTSFDVADFDQQFQSLKETLKKTGEVISTAPKVDAEEPEKINFRILYARTGEAGQTLSELAEISGVRAEEIGIPLSPVSQTAGRRAATTTDSVRINLEELDRIISSTHKLFRQTGELGLLQLSADLMHLRMVPAGKLLQRALRAGRSAAIAIGKEVEFELRGADLLLDKSLSEAIADAVVHLVRNAVDHGIERNEERVKLGKPRSGRILIEAAAFQGQTRITVTDDGRGIDPEVVAKAAKRLGLVQKDAILNSDQCIRLLFRTGFSTAPEVSKVSGRGVGLDVVETGVEDVGGSVRVRGQLGKGSAFEIRLPVTFGLLEVVPITLSGRRYLIDASHVISNPKIENDSSPVWLSSLLGHASADQRNEEQPKLLCQFGDRPTVLIVDEIGERQHALIRGLGRRSGRWFGVAGASELRDGTVVLLLDLPRLVTRR